MNILFWSSLVLCMGCSIQIFWNLSDFSQLLNIRFFPRSTFMKTWYNRKLLKYGTLVGATVAIGINYTAGVIAMPILVAILVIAFIFYYAGIINPKYMMPSQQHNGTFVSIKEASKKVRPSNEVMVIVNNGHARAHPDFEMWRPHIAGDKKGLGGEDIIMTYCSLSNLGMAYRPSIDGVKLNLKVATQLENNLLMWDTKTGEPVQQIFGERECSLKSASKSAMKEFPSFKMPFADFCKAYPDGEVFIEKRVSFFRNPVLCVHDLVMDMLFYFHISKQRNNDEFLFDTIKNIDPEARLQHKENVWGLNIGDDYVCYSQNFITQHGLINTIVNGQRVVLHHDTEYNSINIWYNPAEQDITELNFFGDSNNGKLERVETVKPGAFYGVWYNFFPQTDVNRI